jgi:hypothetical protein
MLRHLLIAIFLTVAALAGAIDLSGNYEATSDGEKYTLTLKQDGDSLTGEAKGEGQTFKLKGTVKGEKATGTLTVTFEGVNVALHFKSEMVGDKLKILVAAPGDDGKPDWSEPDEYLFAKVGGGEAKQPKEKLLSKFSKEPTTVLKNGKEYVHASGGKFRYPGTWTLKEVEGGLQLTPPDAGEGEIYAVVAESAEGATDPASKDVVAYVDMQVRSLFPFVKRVGDVEKANAGNGKGAVVTWEGEKDGQTYRVRGYLTILKNYGVALVAAGPKSKIEGRDKTLREIFHTFGWGQGKVDTNLVGVWNHWSYKGSGSYGRETKAKVVMNADGTFNYNSDTETSMSAQGKTAGGDVAWTGGMASRRGDGWGGTWTADGSTLILNFADGSTETFTYKFKQESNGNVFLIVTEAGGGKPTEWSRG